MDPKGKGIVINDKEKESFVNEPKDDKPTDSGSGHRRKAGKKKTRRIKEIVYYDDSDEYLKHSRCHGSGEGIMVANYITVFYIWLGSRSALLFSLIMLPFLKLTHAKHV
jgi:hypothetical protein